MKLATMDNRVLIVDDDPDMLKLLSRLLSENGFTPMTAVDGLEALKIVLAEAPPIVLTDWMMPNMNGIELCSELRQNDGVGFVYVVIITAYSDQNAIVAAMEAGADDFLYKPVKTQELLLRLRSGYRIGQLQSDLAKRNREAHLHNAKLAVASEKLGEANARLAKLATTDELTELLNRREAMKRLKEGWEQAERHQEPVACILLDIDHFKSVNDTHGHIAGDAVLKAVAATLKRATRTGEAVCRIGGEEFLIVCPRSDCHMAAMAAERLRKAVAETSIIYASEELSVTVSLGVAERIKNQMSNSQDMLHAADLALYRAKEQGRNRVCIMDARAAAPTESGPQTDTDQHSTVDSAEHPWTSQAANIVVLDPDDGARSSCRNLFERDGYTIYEAAALSDAMDVVQQHPIDVVIAERRALGTEIVENLQRLIAAAGPTAPSIVLLANPSLKPEELVNVLQNGAAVLVCKPYEPADLRGRVRSIVDDRQRHQALLDSNATRAEQARALELLLDYSYQAVSATSLQDVLETTVSAIAQLTCSSRISIMLPDADGQHLTVAHAIGMPQETVRSIKVLPGAPVAGKVYTQGEAVIGTGPDPDGTEPDPDDAGGYRYKSKDYISTPLIQYQEGTTPRIVGVLNITERASTQPFSALEIECIGMLCNIAGSAINDHQTRDARDAARDSVVFALAKLAEHRDTDTGKHLERVTRFALILAKDLSQTALFRTTIDSTFLRNLKRAVPLHDIGKVAIPDNILFKPGKFTPEEVIAMRRHVTVGAQTIRSVLERSPGVAFLEMAVDVVSGHHEWYNGEGYPDGLSGEGIPLSARIAALADVYDALTTRRPYKPPFSHEKALSIILDSSGTQFDPAVVDAFHRCKDQFAELANALADAVEPPHDAIDKPRRELPDPNVLTCVDAAANR